MKSGKRNNETSPPQDLTRFTSSLISPEVPADPLKQAIVWLIEGNRIEDVKEALAAKFPTANIETVIAAAGDHFETVAYSDESVIVGWALESCRELYRRMVDCGDYSGALKALSEMLKHSAKLVSSESGDDVHEDKQTGSQEV